MAEHIYKVYAQTLIEKNLSITPVLDKIPFLREWQNICGDEILDQKHQWAWQKANGIGLMMGESSGIICLDIDILSEDERLKDLFEELKAMLPPLYCGILGNADKIPARLYRYNGESSEKFRFINVELLSNGNQKVIPPSIHPITKAEYRWAERSLYDIDVDDLPELPEYLINFLRNKNEDFRYSEKSGSASIELSSEKGRSKHGSHNLISQKMLRLFHQGYSFDDIVDEALLLDDKINDAIDDVSYFLCPSRKEFIGRNRRLNAIRFVSEIIYRNCYRRYDQNDFFKEELADGFTATILDGKKERRVRKHISLYNYLKIKHDIWYCPEIKSFQVWNGKQYQREPEDFVKRFAQKNFKNPSCVSINDKNTFLDYAKNEQQAPVRDFILSDKGMINLRNGIFNLKTRKLEKHNKRYKLSNLIDCDYIEGGETPVWDTLLEVITLGRPHMQKVIEEFIGYCISGCEYKKFNHMLILDGSGSNGKSTLIRIIQELIGEENTSSIGLESINKDRFSSFNLVNKLINFCSEEPKEAFSMTGPIKKITGGDSIMVEEKHKGAFQYHNIAKLIISYNKMPFFPDDSIGMKRRIILIPCEQNFEKRPELKIANVESRIFKEERSALLKKCLDAYLDAVDREAFTMIEEGNSRIEEMITESNSVLGFIDEYVEITGNEGDFISSGTLWHKFEEFKGGRSRYSRDGFAKEFKIQISKNDLVQYSKKPARGYRGIALI